MELEENFKMNDLLKQTENLLKPILEASANAALRALQQSYGQEKFAP